MKRYKVQLCVDQEGYVMLDDGVDLEDVVYDIQSGELKVSGLQTVSRQVDSIEVEEAPTCPK